MARVKGAEAVYEIADLWRERCLADDKSLLWPDAETWTVANIEHMALLLADKQQDESADFFVRTRARIPQDSAAIHRLFDDLTVVWSLMAGAYWTDRKMGWLSNGIVDDNPPTPEIMSLVRTAFDSRIAANEGARGRHAPRRTRQMLLFLEFARRVKADNLDPHDLDTCHELAMAIYPRIPASDNAQDMVLHLLFPDRFEPITSQKVKQAIVKAFPDLVQASDTVDQSLIAIRPHLVERLGREDFSFLDTDVAELWQPVEPSPASPGQPTALQNAFGSFRANPAWSLAVELRQRRALEIRELVTRDMGLTLDEFNREIWLLDTGSRIVSSTKPVGNIDKHLTTDDIMDIRRAIASDDLELHGNHVWRPSTSIFGAQIPKAERASSVENAVAILRDEALTPVTKVSQIDSLPGFGESTATGLVMLVHPTEFAIFNKQSMEAFETLGLRYENLDVFEEDAQSLLTELSAADFLELDAFLYLVAQGKITIETSEQNQLIDDRWPDLPTVQDLAEITFLDLADLSEIEFLLAKKKQIIFEGPPGAGKTFLAELFARYFTGNPLEGAHNEQIEIVQFHQSYGYEDFVQGIRPVTDEDGRLQYRVMPGIFLTLCDRATANPDTPFVLIVDEINRGNLSRIFGELLMLLEYRNKSVRLPYAAGDGATGPTHLTIPGNLYLIGTMNGTDRSLSMIDYALRRRFFFYRLLPVVNGKAGVLERWLSAQAIGQSDRQTVLTYFIGLNLEIDKLLTPDFQIGHSYFMEPDIVTDDGLDRIWRHALRPLLEEYFHTARDRDEIIGRLRPRELRADGGESDALSANDV